MSNVDTGDEKVARVAKHELLSATGEPVKRVEEAAGIRYTILKSGKVFTYQIPGATPGTPLTMFAVFGAKTKATNEASAYRQAVARGDDVEGDEYDAVEETFLSIDNGTWREPSEAVSRGPKYDKSIVAAVLHKMLAGNAKGDVASYQTRLESDKGYYLKVIGRDDIKTAYWKEAEARGQTKPQAPVDALA
jgi:hypothetical protein